MWKSRSHQLVNDRILWFTIEENSPLPFSEVLFLWEQSEEFRDYFIDLLSHSPFKAYRWETPAISSITADRSFEFVLLDSPILERQPNARAFSEHFIGKVPGSVVKFQNLRNDAILVVPSPFNPTDNYYSNIGSFTRNASRSQQHELWKLVGRTALNRLNDQPVWVSTAGAGVPWLHIRLDDRPKYYGYTAYRESA